MHKVPFAIVGAALLTACLYHNPGFDSPDDATVTATAASTLATSMTADLTTTSSSSDPVVTTSTGAGTSTGTTTGDGLASTGDDGTLIVLKATKKYDPSEWIDGDLILDGAHTLSLPTTLGVVVGNAGNHTATLTYLFGGSQSACTYTGGSSLSSPQIGTAEWDKGLVYNLGTCDGQPPPAMITADALHLTVNNGHATVPKGDPLTTIVANFAVL